MHVAIVDGDVSWPPTSGKRLRTLHLMLRLAARHRITYIARCHEGPDAAHRAEAFLREHGVEPIILDDPVPRKSGPAFYARLAFNLLSPLPYSAASHFSRKMCQAVAELAARETVDLWQFEWAPYVGALRHPTTPRVLIAHNVDALIWQRYHEAERHPLRRWYVRGQWRKFERLERRVFSEVDRIVAVSPADAALVRDRFGIERVDVVDNGIDRAYFEEVHPHGRPEDVLFLGSLEWRPNLDGLRLLLDEVFPAVRAAVPSARLSVVGRNPPPWLVQRLAGLEWASLHANVPDVRPHLAGAGVLAVPLRIGGGSRLKVLEALACGLPVVSTRVGAEGLCLRGGEHLDVVENVEDMAAALVKSIHDPERPRRQAAAGRELVRQRYDWGPLAGKLEEVWQRCVGAPREKEAACASCS